MVFGKYIPLVMFITLFNYVHVKIAINVYQPHPTKELAIAYLPHTFPGA